MDSEASSFEIVQISYRLWVLVLVNEFGRILTGSRGFCRVYGSSLAVVGASPSPICMVKGNRWSIRPVRLHAYLFHKLHMDMFYVLYIIHLHMYRYIVHIYTASLPCLTSIVPSHATG